MLCTRQCEAKAITVENNLAHVNYEACTQCGKCAEMCPTKVIIPPATQPAGADAHIAPAKEPQPVGADAHIGPSQEKKES